MTTSLLSPSPLIVVATGPEPDALDGLRHAVPANAVCLPSVPQVRLLQAAASSSSSSLAAITVVTHGGQNTFMESLSVGAPMVVCPGFGDQAANAARAQSLGVGVKVDRPAKSEPLADSEMYEAAVAGAIRQVMDTLPHQACLAKAGAIAAELKKAGGVERAAQIVAQATR